MTGLTMSGISLQSGDNAALTDIVANLKTQCGLVSASASSFCGHSFHHEHMFVSSKVKMISARCKLDVAWPSWPRGEFLTEHALHCAATGSWRGRLGTRQIFSRGQRWSAWQRTSSRC